MRISPRTWTTVQITAYLIWIIVIGWGARYPNSFSTNRSSEPSVRIRIISLNRRRPMQMPWWVYLIIVTSPIKIWIWWSPHHPNFQSFSIDIQVSLKVWIICSYIIDRSQKCWLVPQPQKKPITWRNQYNNQWKSYQDDGTDITVDKTKVIKKHIGF